MTEAGGEIMRVRVVEREGFKLLQSAEFIRSGDVAMTLSREVLQSSPTRTSIRVGPGEHVEDPVGAFINHSCSPSCRVEGADVVALRDLPVGTEITFDYSVNEGDLASPFTCLECGELLRGPRPPCKAK